MPPGPALCWGPAPAFVALRLRDVGAELLDELLENCLNRALAHRRGLAADVRSALDGPAVAADLDRHGAVGVALAAVLLRLGLDDRPLGALVGLDDLDRAAERHRHRAHVHVDLGLRLRRA